MACICENCGRPTYDCGARLCARCELDKQPDDTSKNIFVGGRFYGEKLERDNPVGHVDL